MNSGMYEGTWKFYNPDGSTRAVCVYRKDTLMSYRRDTMIGKTKYIYIKHQEFIHLESDAEMEEYMKGLE
jgi:hypothetical protein